MIHELDRDDAGVGFIVGYSYSPMLIISKEFSTEEIEKLTNQQPGDIIEIEVENGPLSCTCPIHESERYLK